MWCTTGSTTRRSRSLRSSTVAATPAAGAPGCEGARGIRYMGSLTEVYVALLDECPGLFWRPVAAEAVGPGLFRLAGTVPEGKTWQFQPGDVVRCAECEFSGGNRRLAAVARPCCP